MPLSRHLYEVDEVQSALGYCTTRHDPKETLFWCNELLLSGYVAEPIQVLFEAWLWHKGPFCLNWLLSAWNTLSKEEIQEKEILSAAYQLSHHASIRDHSLWNLLVLGHQPPSEPLTFKTPPCIPFTDVRSLFFLRSLYQGKAHHAWWMAQQLNTTTLWECLEWYRVHCMTETHSSSYQTLFTICQSYSHLLGYSTDSYDRIMRCLAVLSCCLSDKQRERSLANSAAVPLLPSSLESFLSDKEADIGRKRYRTYSIPIMCLYGTTRRGQMRWTEHTLSHLYDVEPHLIGCPFWEDALSPFAVIDQTCIQWNSYDAKEEFYRSYFPDDIPDEWTKDDQQKSHGEGVLGPRDTPSLLRYTQKYLSHLSRLFWNSTSATYSYLEKNPTSALHPRDYSFQPKEKEPKEKEPQDSSSLFVPKHRRFRCIS